MSLFTKAQDTLKRECQFEAGSSVLVACSGGADSVALLHLLSSQRKRLKINKLGVYHLNHGVRGEESDADEVFVKELAGKFGLPFHYEREDVSSWAAEHGVSLEMAGRKLRYIGINKLLESEGYTYAALGHTASDNAEWLLLSLVRGRAEPLLWGIPARRDRYIRPLIRCTRKEVLRYLESNRLSFREDSSNASLSFDRNLIRHRVIPQLKELNPSIEETLSRSLKIGDALKSSLDSEAAELLSRLSGRLGRELDTPGLSGYNLATQLRVLRLFAPWLGADDMLRLLPLKTSRGTREIARGAGQRIICSYGRLTIEDLQSQPVWKPRVLHEGKPVLVPVMGWRLHVHVAESCELAGQEDTVYFDASQLRPPFDVRAWHEGDRMIPFARHSAVKLKRIFIEKKVPRMLRRYWPLICKNEKVIWAAGLVRSADAPITDLTRELTILTLLRGEDGN